jgi:hypothetical protein
MSFVRDFEGFFRFALFRNADAFTPDRRSTERNAIFLPVMAAGRIIVEDERYGGYQSDFGAQPVNQAM